MNRFSLLLTLALLPACALAQTVAPPDIPNPPPGVSGQEGLNATAWVQTSAESRIAALQAYRLATRQLDVALKDKNWTAAVEQGRDYRKLPPAVILDLDETVLDNSPYQARLVRDNAVYSGASWESWVNEAAAPAIAGSVAFLRAAAGRGVRIFYVSNRGAAEETATRENLKRLGAPIDWRFDAVLMNGERPAWTSDKTSRRAFVAQTHRVLLIVGDDMNDFVPAKPLTLAERDALLNRYADYWGDRWILLSNPLYGSWEGALFDYRYDLSREEILRRKYQALRFGATEVVAVEKASTATR